MRIVFSETDLADYQKRMTRMTRELGMTPQAAQRVGVLTYLKSVRASTKRAPQKRTVRVSGGARGHWVVDKSGRRNRIFYAEGLDRKTGGVKNIPIFARSLAEAKEDPRAIILRWGLARKSWGWMMHKLYGQMLGDENQTAVERPGMVDATQRFDFSTGYAETTLENKLNYIWAALGSRAPVDMALARANKSMAATIQQKVDRATREAGY